LGEAGEIGRVQDRDRLALQPHVARARDAAAGDGQRVAGGEKNVPARAQLGEEVARLARQSTKQEREAGRTSKLFTPSANIVAAAPSLFPAPAPSPLAAGPDRVRSPVSANVVQAGSIIPAALLTGIRSDLPGLVVAQVARPETDMPLERGCSQQMLQQPLDDSVPAHVNIPTSNSKCLNENSEAACEPKALSARAGETGRAAFERSPLFRGVDLWKGGAEPGDRSGFRRRRFGSCLRPGLEGRDSGGLDLPASSGPESGSRSFPRNNDAEAAIL
jgi:hypothetical protein